MAGQGIEAVRDIRHLPSVFDRGRFGLNVAVGLAYSLAVLLFEASEYLATPCLGDAGPGCGLALYYAATAAIVVLEGAAFVAVVHRMRGAWSLAVVWGVIAGGFEASFGATAGVFSMLPPEPLPGALLAGSAAADGALLMGGLALAVRWWGVTAESFVLGAAGACLVHAVPMRIALAAVRPDAQWGWAVILGWGVVRGVVTGSVMYAGVVAHLNRRRTRPAG